MMYLAKTVFMLTLVSVLIAFMLAPIVELCRRLRLPRSIGSLIAVLVMCATLYGVFYVSYNQADEFMSQLPKYSGQIRNVLERGADARRARPPDNAERAAGGEGRKGYAHRSSIQQLDGRPDQRGGRSHRSCADGSLRPFLVFFMLSWQDHVRSSTVMLFSPENRSTAYQPWA